VLYLFYICIHTMHLVRVIKFGKTRCLHFDSASSPARYTRPCSLLYSGRVNLVVIYYSVTNKCTNKNYFIVFISIDVFPYTCFGP
jgi:hypothetical protein